MSAQDSDPWLSVTNASHYALDGVPLRVSNIFRPKPPQKESLPAGLRFNPAQSQVLDFEYKYETEEGYIKWYDDTVSQKLEKQREKEERLKADEEQLKAEAEKQAAEAKTAEEAKVEQNGDSCRQSPVPMKPSRPAPVPPISRMSAQPVAAATVPVSNSILQPERASPVTVMSQQPMKPLKSKDMSLRDFENLGEDPFDTAELKTINTMEVLESVLANSQGIATDITSDQTYEESHPKPSDNGEPNEQLYMNPQEILRKRPPYENISLNKPQSSLVAAAKKKGPVASPRTSMIENNLNGDSQQTASFNPKSETVNIETKPKSKPSQNSYENNIPVKLKPPTKPKPAGLGQAADGDKVVNDSQEVSEVKTESGNGNVQSLANALSKDLDVSKYRPPGAPRGFSYLPPTTTDTESKTDSTTDLKDIEWPSLDSNPATPDVSESYHPRLHKKYDPPPRPKSMPSPAVIKDSPQAAPTNPFLAPGNSITNSAILKQKVPPAKPPPPKLPPPPKINREPAPIKSPEDTLLHMGFDKQQIEAAMTHLGSDKQQLVDHLCAVQQLVTTGVKWENAQQGVLMFTSDLTKAEKFAQSYQRLNEFGFEDEKMKEALINCDMDFDKALEKLLS